MPILSEHRFSFPQLAITSAEIAEFMGFEPGSVPDPFSEIIDRTLVLSNDICHPAGGYLIFDNPGINSEKGTLSVNDKIFHPAKVVISQVKDATGVAFFLCTVGKEITGISKEIANNGDTMTGYVLDIIGSIAADKTAELVQLQLEQNCNDKGLNISDRFSPGYCEWSVAEQQLLFSLFPEKIFGIELSESSLMSPVKSVSGIIGIGKNLSRKGYQCHWCTDKDCFTGKLNRSKKDKKN